MVLGLLKVRAIMLLRHSCVLPIALWISFTHLRSLDLVQRYSSILEMQVREQISLPKEKAVWSLQPIRMIEIG